MSLVSERERGGSNTFKASHRVVKGGERVGKRSPGGGNKVAILQQESIVSVEIHKNFEGDVGIVWCSPLLQLFISEFIVNLLILDLAFAREKLPEILKWAEDREVSEEVVGGWVAGRFQRNVTVHRWHNLLRGESNPEPRSAVPALFLNLIQANGDGEGSCRLLKHGRHPLRILIGQRCLPHGKKVGGLRAISAVCVSG